MGEGCSREELAAAVDKSCGQIKNHLTDMSEAIIGNTERNSGGIRLFDFHGSSAASIIIGLLVGILLGTTVTTTICRRRYKPWRLLATGQEQQQTGSPCVKLSRGEAVARLSSLRAGKATYALPPQADATPGTPKVYVSRRALSDMRGLNETLATTNAQLTSQLWTSQAALQSAGAQQPPYNPYSRAETQNITKPDSRRASAAPQDANAPETRYTAYDAAFNYLKKEKP